MMARELWKFIPFKKIIFSKAKIFKSPLPSGIKWNNDWPEMKLNQVLLNIFLSDALQTKLSGASHQTCLTFSFLSH